MLDKQSRRERGRAVIIAACWDLARERGLASFSLKDVASAVGVQAPSLYSYFKSKNAMYDEMFADGNRAFIERIRALPKSDDTRQSLRAAAHAFVGFCAEDPARHQLLFQRVVAGFEPSAAAYATAIEVFTLLRESFTSIGITNPKHVDIWTALVSGLAAQQLANDPGGNRWTALVDSAVDMFADFVTKEQS